MLWMQRIQAYHTGLYLLWTEMLLLFFSGWSLIGIRFYYLYWWVMIMGVLIFTCSQIFHTYFGLIYINKLSIAIEVNNEILTQIKSIMFLVVLIPSVRDIIKCQSLWNLLSHVTVERHLATVLATATDTSIVFLLRSPRNKSGAGFFENT